jgi:hypothetical protein
MSPRGPLTMRDRALVSAGINLAERDFAMREARGFTGARRTKYVQLARQFNRLAMAFRQAVTP